MKNYLFVFAALVLFSCSDDPLSESIVGTWDLVSIEATGCDDPAENVPFTEVDDSNCITAQGETACNIFYTFRSDGTATQNVTFDGDTDVEEFTYTVNDDNDTVLLCDSFGDCGTINVDGNDLTVTLVDEDGCNTAFVYKKA